MAQKHVAFAPASQKQLGSRLRSPLLRRETMPAQPFSRFFHHTALAKQGKRKRGQATFSLRKRKSLLMDRTTEKVACPLFLRVCLSGASYAAAERSEWRMAFKI